MVLEARQRLRPAAKALGLDRVLILLRHAPPNAVGPVIAVYHALGIFIVTEATLSTGSDCRRRGVLGWRHQCRADPAQFCSIPRARWRLRCWRSR